MKLLITGATGLIGTQITKVLLDSDIDVNYLTTSKEKIEHKKGYRGFFWDPENGVIDSDAFKDVTAIINLVGASIGERWTKSYKKVILESRTQTANLLFDTLQEIDHQITHFISASGVSVYPSHKSKLYRENDPEVAKTFLGEVVVA
ncbi:MAG: NAD-dependent epimerase/dehydratase family protein, partial [Marinirhabdus sp.]|nr:NAD-dependent epimerase/dehydratase family protein [Marinirhabdus sp.]